MCKVLSFVEAEILLYGKATSTYTRKILPNSLCMNNPN
jgi:hypothetical protein